MDSRNKRVHELVRELKKEFPLPYSVSVNVTPKKIFYDLGNGTKQLCSGISWLDLKKKKFYIKIYRGSCLRCILETLIHEWCHARIWGHRHDVSEEPEFHDSAWGLEYAKIYSFIMDEK